MNGSIIVNPWNTEELAQAIEDAITMSDEQRALNHVKLYKYVTRYSSQYWGISLYYYRLMVGQTFVTELRRISEQSS